MFETIEEKQSCEKEIMMVTLLNNVGTYLLKHGKLISHQYIDDDYVTIYARVVEFRGQQYEVIADEFDGFIFAINKHN